VIWFLFLSLAFANESSDIEAGRTFSGDAEKLMQHLSDMETVSQIFPERCVRNWSGSGQGLGSKFELIYTMGMWKRKLRGTVTRANVQQGVEWDHEGKRGFVTRWTLESGEETSTLRVKTWIAPPPWPFKRHYFRRIKPMWELCYRQALDAVTELSTSAGMD
jgi:hypothetical protein